MKIALCPWRGIELVLPRGASEAQGQAFLASRRQWMEQAWRRLRERVPEAFESDAPDSLYLSALERRWRLCYDPASRRLHAARDWIRLPGPARVSVARDSLKPWLMEQARAHLPDRVAELSADSGLTFARVQVRDQHTRWGSCSSHGTISLNFRILFHRPRVRDYLILHELCHTRHMNHGARFRALMGELEPDWRALDRELSRPAGGVPGWLGW